MSEHEGAAQPSPSRPSQEETKTLHDRSSAPVKDLIVLYVAAAIMLATVVCFDALENFEQPAARRLGRAT